MKRLLPLLALLALVTAACGPGAGTAPTQTKLTVTDGFGGRTLVERASPKAEGSDTVMRLLQRNAKVRTRYGGGFVQSIDGLRGGRANGRPVDWFYFVNGILEDKGAGAVDVTAGDRIWWDRHDWGTAPNIPAVVGSFPEPFLSGRDGKKFPTRIECDEAVADACDTIQKKLAGLGLVVGKSRIGTEGGSENLRVLVGRWPQVRRDIASARLEEGPKASGVFARPSADGRSISALDARGREVRKLGAGTGLIAATRWEDWAPTWIVTGTDDAGVRAAAAALDESVLAEKFALAIHDGLPVALPAAADGAG